MRIFMEHLNAQQLSGCRLDYQNKHILAPMVRIGRLPTRLLALKYGADIVYSEEIIDHRFIRCKRIINDRLNTIDFVQETDNFPMFRTCSAERHQVVFQMGTADADRALKAAKLVENDVAGIDVNMGCPKEYSTKGGMGAALLNNPEKVKKILTTLVKNLSIPITCKIRILPDMKKTIELVKLIASTGVAALAVHGRYKGERPRHPVHCDVIRKIVETVSIPVIANGGSVEYIQSFADIQKFKEATNASSVMIARSAQYNCSVFRREGVLPTQQVIKDYLEFAVNYDNHYINCKYCLLEVMHDCQESEKGVKLRSAVSLQEICDIFEMGDQCRQVFKQRESMDGAGENGEPLRKKLKNDDVITMEFVLKRCDFDLKSRSPKSILLEWTHDKKFNDPVYNTAMRESDRRFQSTVLVNGQKYQTTYWEKNKRLSEQSAAIVCLRSLGLDDGRKSNNNIQGNEGS
ncbi:tRNA-dihydrouridine(20) synthase [NAD(P)+]-like isoform X1 [Clavelina lepadiformis]|uniref:tRNA-dihydrouridine(20) synthase [NAD(P)+]-like isoform X1 n=2 Tax=Clavelina lepadiformis TaxID=159417 RepID=UPI004042CC88